ncbi:histidine kinase [Pseudoalteromonas haloplanktis]|uniref:Histidine kinase n=1 Tax=Pseudoalteromonas haloplanktis TaxID=228 RepID=A0ABU1B749_PSEHA|nr:MULTISPECIES: histidine kinase [Pseudoalteromonas]MDQ9090131.1 histidine kinase [Pseudoalteromonas haloplanktis]TMN70749.1 sensor histidine kinase [Pseudoalteromonas sp. S1727]
MFKHPFYKYSFCLLLIVDIAYALAIVISNSAPISIDTVIASLVWFVTFYWVPVWAAAALIFQLRKNGNKKIALEWLIAVVFMATGNVITDHVLVSLYDDYRPLGVFVIFNGLIWGSCIYCICIYIESKKKVASEKHSRKKAQLATLRYQLNPHFMFNSLNTISAYIHTNPDLADEVLHELADILRYSLDTAEQTLIPLEQELAIIEKYLNIEKARFGEKLQVNYTLPEQLKSIHIPPLIIQPIIENAIKHNAQQNSLTVNIELTVIDNLVRVKVSDNGIGFNEHVLKHGYGTGVGMKNIQQRVNQLGNSKINLSNNNGAVVCLELAL